MKEKLLVLFRDPKNKLLLAGFLLMGISILMLRNFGRESKPTSQEADSFSADTVIPVGFVLVPVEIQNIESLSSLIGNFAVVDLFTTIQVQQKGGVRVGRRIRLLRAPLNPQSFAALVAENEAHELLAAQGPFVAVIQNPAHQNPGEVSRARPSVSSIEYFKKRVL